MDVNNGQDIIDSRYVIARIEELQEDRAEFADELEACEEQLSEFEPDEIDNETDAKIIVLKEEREAALQALEAWDNENADELKALVDLAEEASGYAADWQYGEALIRESYFTEYAQQLADDIGAVNSEAGWPNSYIDWDAAADALKTDYTAVEFDGVTYYIR